MNFRQINNGKTNALDTTHVGGSAIAPGPMDKDLIDAFFIVLRTKLRNVPVIHNEYVVGQSNSFFTIPDNPSELKFDDNGMAAAQKGALPIFIFAVLKYRDDLIPKEKSIYTEKCVYLLASVVHFCETGIIKVYSKLDFLQRYAIQFQCRKQARNHVAGNDPRLSFIVTEASVSAL